MELSTKQLNEALYHLVDIMDRCLCPFILLGETARSIIEDDTLKGSGLTIGVRVGDFNESVQSMLRTLASNVDIRLGINDFKQTPEECTWTYHGVPISIKIIRRKYNFFHNVDFAWYMAEEYKIPNPFTGYWKARYLIK